MAQEPRSFSERTAQAIDQEVARLLAAAQERVRATLLDRRSALEALAKLLLEKEVVDGAGLRELLDQHPAAGAARPPTAEIKAA
jgi:cell division protease FtsH